MKRKLMSFVITLILISGFFIVSSSLALADPVDSTLTNPQAASTTCSNKATFFGLPAWYEYLPLQVDPENGTCTVYTDDLTIQKTITLILLAILDILFRLGAIVAVIFVVYGGFMFITSQGEPAKIVSARKAILNAIIGLVIVILASQIVKFIAKFLSTSV